METLIFWLIGIIINFVLGAIMLISLDTKDKVFSKWYDSDPSKGIFGFIAMSLWPILAFFIIRYRIRKEKDNVQT